MPYRNPRDRKPWRERPEAKQPTRGWIFVGGRTVSRLERKAKRLGLSRHELGDRILKAILAAFGA